MKNSPNKTTLIICISIFINIHYLYAQTPTIENSENHIVDISQDASYKIAAAVFTSTKDTIDLLYEFDKNTFRVMFMNYLIKDSTVISIDEINGSTFLLGCITYTETFLSVEAHFDIYHGRVTSGVNKEEKKVDILINRFSSQPNDENDYYMLAITYADDSRIQLVFYNKHEKYLSRK